MQDLIFRAVEDSAVAKANRLDEEDVWALTEEVTMKIMEHVSTSGTPRKPSVIFRDHDARLLYHAYVMLTERRYTELEFKDWRDEAEQVLQNFKL